MKRQQRSALAPTSRNYQVEMANTKMVPREGGTWNKARHDRWVVIDCEDGKPDKMTHYIAGRIESIKQYFDDGDRVR